MRTSILAAALGFASAATAQISTITTTMVGGVTLGGYVGANTLYFDIDVTNPAGLIVTQFDLRTQLGPNGVVTVYRTAPGVSQSTNRANATAWTAVGTANVTGAGTSIATLQMPFVLATGTYGMAIHMTDLQAVYTNPTTQNPPLPPTFSNADVTINCTDARIQNSTPTAPISGGVSVVRTPNLIMYYSAAGLVSNFNANVTSGNAPLAVQFQSAALSTDPLGIIAYNWDFDGDGITDSNLQNPLHTYTQCGTYNVSLTVIDINGAATETKPNFITVDPLAVDFSWTKIADPATFQFNDLSSSSARAWDLNGDGIVDSNAQNPVFVYPAGCGAFPVTLTVNNNCRNGTRTKDFVPLPGMTTLFNANNAGAVGTGNFFDANITNPDGLSLCAVSVNANGGTGTNVNVDVYITPSTYVGKDSDGTQWTLIGSGVAVSRGFQNSTTVSFPSVYLAPGSYGFAVYQTGVGPAYSGTGANPAPGLPAYSNADMALSLGIARNGLFGAATTVFTPRIWNGTLHYETVAQGLAIHQVFGAGCAGALGVPGNVAATMPRVGQTLTLNFTNMPGSVGFHMLGFSRTASLFGPLPVDLTSFGAPGCFGRVSTDAVSLMIGAGNQASFSWTLPAGSAFLGARFFSQALVLDPTANGLGAVTSDAAQLVLGL